MSTRKAHPKAPQNVGGVAKPMMDAVPKAERPKGASAASAASDASATSDASAASATSDALNAPDASADTKVAVYDIVYTTETYADRAQTNKHLSTLLAINPDLLKLLPSCQLEHLTFRLTGYTSLANGIRRAMVEEVPVDCLSFSDAKFQTDDSSILPDYFKSCIEMVALVQAEDFGANPCADVKFSLRVTNKTMREIYVYAGDIVGTRNGKPIPASAWTSYPNTPISKLKPGKTIYISEFEILRGIAMNDAGKFTALNATEYEILGIKFYDEESNEGVRSEECMPSEFRIGLRTKSNISARAFMRKVVDVLVRRIKKMIEHLKTYQTNPDAIHTDWLEVIQRRDHVSYIFIGEYTTTVSMLSQNCYFLDPDIKFVIPQSENPNSVDGSVEITHDDATNLLIRAAEKSVVDLELVRRAFV